MFMVVVIVEWPSRLLNDLRVFSQFQQQGGVGVAEPLEGDPGQSVDLGGGPGESSSPAAGDGVGHADGSPVVAEDVRIGSGKRQGDCTAVGFVRLEDTERFDIDVDDAGGARLGDLGGVGSGDVDGSAQTDPCGVEVDVGPAQAEGFRAPHAGEGQGAPQGEQFILEFVAVPRKEGVELRTGPRDDLGLLGADLAGCGRVDRAPLLRGAENDQAVVDCRVEQGRQQDVDLGDSVGRQRRDNETKYLVGFPTDYNVSVHENPDKATDKHHDWVVWGIRYTWEGTGPVRVARYLEKPSLLDAKK